jgi:hypothetical protein
MVGLINGVRSPRTWLLILGFCITAILGYWLAGTAAPKALAKASPSSGISLKVPIQDDPAPRFRREERKKTFRSDEEAKEEGALPGQRILAFKDRESLEKFLERAGDQVSLSGRLDALHALRVSFLNFDDLASLLDGNEQLSLVFPVDLQPPSDGTIQAGAQPLGAGLLEWLGVTGDNSTWGSGVRIAVLDTGVASHPAFSSAISWLNLVALPGESATQNGHGTAVASVIIGQDPLTPGVAPGAEIISIRIANDLGQSDSFLLAQGIVSAVDAGARLINISMGSFGNSVLVENAVEYARAAGALIVAAAGNHGVDRVTYPAANPGVIAVGAVDALGNHLNFSNTGSQVAISAPGYGVNAAWVGDQAARVSGTSFSAPIVTGAIAALMSRSGAAQLSAGQASALLFAYLNDGGDVGADSALGAGMPDLGRVLNADKRGIYDAAVASQRMIPSTSNYPNGQIEVMVQNRGTERLINTTLQISTPSGAVTSNITSLDVNAVHAVRVPITRQTATHLRYDSKVILSGGYRDAKPSNDRRVESYVPANVQ